MPIHTYTHRTHLEQIYLFLISRRSLLPIICACSSAYLRCVPLPPTDCILSLYTQGLAGCWCTDNSSSLSPLSSPILGWYLVPMQLQLQFSSSLFCGNLATGKCEFSCERFLFRDHFLPAVLCAKDDDEDRESAPTPLAQKREPKSYIIIITQNCHWRCYAMANVQRSMLAAQTHNEYRLNGFRSGLCVLSVPVIINRT